MTTIKPSYCIPCQAQAEALEIAIANTLNKQSVAVNAQNYAYQAAFDMEALVLNATTLVTSQAENQILLNNTIQTLLQSMQNQTSRSIKSLVVLPYILQAKNLTSQVTSLILQASTKVKTVATIAISQVSQQQSLLNDMITATNSSKNFQPVDLFQFAKTLLNKTLEATNDSQVLLLTEIEILKLESQAVSTSLQIKDISVALLSLANQFQLATKLSSQETKKLVNSVNTMVSILSNVTDSLNVCISKAIPYQQATKQVYLTQSDALEASKEAARLALCYPNPCLHGGMCTSNIDSMSFTCFCSGNYIGNVLLLHKYHIFSEFAYF